MLQKISTANPYIHKFRQALSQVQPLAIDWLVLSHDDTQMLARLDEAFPDSVLAVLTLPPNLLPMDNDWIAELVEWAIAELGIKGALLVGHAQREVPEEQVKFLGGQARAIAQNGAESLVSSPSILERMKMSQLRAEHIQDQLANLIDKLGRLTLKQGQILRDQIQLHGLFYRPESGIFYAYDPRQRRFKSLLNETALA